MRLQVADVAQVHWRVAPDAVAAVLPVGLRPLVVDGSSYAGLLAMGVRDVRPLGLPALPVVSRYAEVNVRVYATLADATRVVHFRSLDVSSPLAAGVGRLGTGLPWRWSRVRVRRSGGVVRYLVRRRTGARQACRLVLRVGDPTAGTALERRLVEQDVLALRRLGQLRTWSNRHPGWPLHRASVIELTDDLVEAAGVEVDDPDPVSVLFSPGLPMSLSPG